METYETLKMGGRDVDNRSAEVRLRIHNNNIFLKKKKTDTNSNTDNHTSLHIETKL